MAEWIAVRALEQGGVAGGCRFDPYIRSFIWHYTISCVNSHLFYLYFRAGSFSPFTSYIPFILYCNPYISTDTCTYFRVYILTFGDRVLCAPTGHLLYDPEFQSCVARLKSVIGHSFFGNAWWSSGLRCALWSEAVLPEGVGSI